MKDTTIHLLVILLGLMMLLFVLIQAHEEEDQMKFHSVLDVHQYDDTYYRITMEHITIDSLTSKGLETVLINFIEESKQKSK